MQAGCRKQMHVSSLRNAQRTIQQGYGGKAMDKYIIFYGKTKDIVYAASLADALAKARVFALAKGMSFDESHDDDEVFAREFDPWLAKDHGLMWLDEAERHWEIKEARQ